VIHPISHILRNSPSRKKLNILCFPTHEGYQTALANTGHNFYMMGGPNLKSWDYHTRPLPPNHYIYPISNGLRFDIEIDLILTQERFNQLPMGLDIQKTCGAPLVHLEHTEPPPGINEKQLAKIQVHKGQKHVYITDYNRNSWADPTAVVIPHGIDEQTFQGYNGTQTHGVSVVNLFPQRDRFCGWNIYQEVAKLIPLKLYGYNPGLSESINNPKVLSSRLAESRFYLNTSILSPVPLSLLEAACVGLPIVSTAYQEVPKIFTHGSNAFLSNDPQELVKYCKILLENPDLAKTMGDEARKLVLNRFSMSQFVSNWNSVFESVLKGN